MRYVLLIAAVYILAGSVAYAGEYGGSLGTFISHSTSDANVDSPVVSDIDKACASIAFTVSSSSATIRSIVLDNQKSSNMAISVHDTLPAGSFRVELRLLDRTKIGYFIVTITDSQGESIVFSDTLYPADSVFEIVSPVAGGEVFLASSVKNNARCSEVLLRNRSSDTVVISMLSCVLNIQFSAPFGQFPLTVLPYDTARVRVCYMPSDTMLYRDTLRGDFGCVSIQVPLASKGEEFGYTGVGNCGRRITLSGTRPEEAQMRAYPAPATDEVAIPVAYYGGAGASAVLYNAIGKPVAVGQFEAGSVEMAGAESSSAYFFSVAHLPVGIYYAVIISGAESATVPVAVAR